MPNIAEAAVVLECLYLGAVDKDLDKKEQLLALTNCKLIVTTLREKIRDGVLQVSHFPGLTTALNIKIKSIQNAEDLIEREKVDGKHHKNDIVLRSLNASMNLCNMIATHKADSKVIFTSNDQDFCTNFNIFCDQISKIERFCNPVAKTVARAQFAPQLTPAAAAADAETKLPSPKPKRARIDKRAADTAEQGTPNTP